MESCLESRPDAGYRALLPIYEGILTPTQLHRWQNLLMGGKRGAPMQERPFDLIRATVTDAQGKPLFQRPLWLLVLGSRRREVRVHAT